jgi:hypothetical protein
MQVIIDGDAHINNFVLRYAAGDVIVDWNDR